jgi:hypothetical protein
MSADRILPWIKLYRELATDMKIDEVADMADAPVAVVLGLWVTLLLSTADEDGAVSIRPRGLALRLGIEARQVEAILAAFESPEIGMIGDGRIVKWSERQRGDSVPPAERMRQSREKARQEAERPRLAAGGAPRAPDLLDACAEAPVTPVTPVTPRYADVTFVTAVTIDSRSDSDSDSDRESSSSSVVPFARPRTDDDDEILISKISEALGPRVAPRVARIGLAAVRGWIAEGFDFELDVLRALREISQLQKPVQKLAAPWVRQEWLLPVRDGRLNAAARPPPAAPPQAPPRPPPHAAEAVDPVRRRELADGLRRAAAGLAAPAGGASP